MTSTKIDVPPTTIADADTLIAQKEAELAALETKTRNEITNLIDGGASEDKVKEAHAITQAGAESREALIGQTLEQTRAVYIKEYLKCKAEKGKQIRMEKIRTQISNIKTKAGNVFWGENKATKTFNEEDYFTKEYKEAKETYNRTRVEMGSMMYDAKKVELQRAGLSGTELEAALTQYKATEILEKVIIEERNKLIQAKAEGAPINPAAWKKLVQTYLSIKPKWKRVALSTALFLPFAAAGSGATMVASYGVAGLVTYKFVKSMVTGTLVAHSVKGIDVLDKGLGFKKKFETSQEEKRDELKKKFALGEISLEQLEQYEHEDDHLVKEKKSREQKIVLLKAGLGIAIAGIASYEMAHATQSLEGTTSVRMPPTSPVIPENKIVTESAPEVVVDDTVHEAPKLHDSSLDKPYEDPNNTVSRTHTSDIHPLTGDYNTGGESTINPHEGRFETNTDAAIHPKVGDFNEGEPHTLETTPVVPKGDNLLNNQKAPNELLKQTAPKPDSLLHTQKPPVDTVESGKLSTQNLESRQVAPAGATEQATLPKTNADDLASRQTAPAGVSDKTIETKTSDEIIGSKQVPPAENIDQATAPKITSGALENKQVPLGNIVDQTTPKINQDTLESRQVPPANTTEQAALPKNADDLTSRQVPPAGVSDKVAAAPATPKVEEAVVSPRSTFNNGSGRPISPTRGVFNTGGNAYSAPLEARTPTIEPGNGFTTSVPITNEAGVESVYDNQNRSAITTHYETTAAEPTTIKGMEADARHLEKASDVREVFGRRNIVLEKPEHDTIRGIKVKDLNRAIDDKLSYKELNKQVKFESYSDYQKEKELQSFFGDSKQVVKYVPELDKQANVIEMHYFRELPEWKIVQKIPAKYFFDFTDAKEFNGTTLVDIPKGDLEKLLDAGILKKEVFTMNGVDTEKYVFSRQDDLLRLQKTYTALLSKEDIALGNNMPLVTNTGEENIESYIRRLTRRVFETDDGTYFAPKKVYVPSIQTDGNVVQQEQIYRGGSMQGSSSIAPRYGVYQTRSDYFYNNQLASRARDIIINRISTPVRFTR